MSAFATQPSPEPDNRTKTSSVLDRWTVTFVPSRYAHAPVALVVREEDIRDPDNPLGKNRMTNLRLGFGPVGYLSRWKVARDG